MALMTIQPKSVYPRYLYHKDYDEPIRVDSKEEEAPLLNQGWVVRYLHKEYPKRIGDQRVFNAEQEAEVLAGAKKKRTISPNRTYVCDVCGEVFKHPYEKAQHVRKTGHKLVKAHKATQVGGKENPEPQFKKE